MTNATNALHATASPSPDAIRVTIRARAGHFRKEIDVSLPADASLDEVLGEVTELMGAPIVSKPWRASTAAGRFLDHAVPLADAPLADGALILLRPHSPVAPPVVRDAAEELAATAAGEAHGLASAWAALGLAGLVVLVGAAAAPALGSLAWPAALALGAALALALHLWARAAAPLAPLFLACVAGAAFFFVGEWRLGLVAGAAGLAAAAGLLHVVRLGSPRLAGGALTLSVLGLAAGAAGFLPGLEAALSPAHPAGQRAGAAAVTCAAAVLLAALAPGASTRLAGLRVPQLPTAGEDLAVADLPATADNANGTAARAARARALYDGCLLGIALALLPAAGVLAGVGAGRGYALAACLALAGALLLHSARQATALGTWALAAGTAASCAAACAIAARAAAAGDYAWPLILAAGLIVVAAATCPLWARLVASLEPTTLVWFERAEMACIAALFPLALHLAGVFALIRGLG